MSKCFIIRDEETIGPFSLDDLKDQATDGRLLRTDFIDFANGGFPRIADSMDDFTFPSLASEQDPPEGLIRPVLDSEDPDTFLTRGLYYSRLGEFELAILYFDDVIDAYDSAELVHASRGFCHEMLGNNASAISDFSKQIELEPDNPDPYMRRSHLSLLQEDIEQSLSDAVEACRLGPARVKMISKAL
jgi:tetratricopeptide (TPR) repeat protein